MCGEGSEATHVHFRVKTYNINKIHINIKLDITKNTRTKGYVRTDVLGQNELFISIHVFSARMLSDFYQSKSSSFLN